MYDLVVVDVFDGYQRGDIISDHDAVEFILNSEHAHKVNKITKQEV